MNGARAPPRGCRRCACRGWRAPAPTSRRSRPRSRRPDGAAARHRPRPARPRPVGLRPQSDELQCPGRAGRRPGGADCARDRPRRVRRHVARRDPDHAARRGRPTALAGCVLNDIGPVIDPKGLMRIKSYVGKLPRVASLHEAADVLRRLFGAQFPKLSDDEWVAFARRTFKDARGRIVPDYDVQARQGAGRGQPRKTPARAVERVRRHGARAAHGDPRRQFRHAVAAQRSRPCGAPPRDGRRSRCPIRVMRRCCREPALIARIAAFAAIVRPAGG